MHSLISTTRMGVSPRQPSLLLSPGRPGAHRQGLRVGQRKAAPKAPSVLFDVLAERLGTHGNNGTKFGN